jgi:hypothetical protein
LASLFQQFAGNIHGHDRSPRGGEHLRKQTCATPDFKDPFPCTKASAVDNEFRAALGSEAARGRVPAPHLLSLLFRKPLAVYNLSFRSGSTA